MESTDTLGLNLVEDNDTIDPADFNKNFETLDKLGNDYVVAYGTKKTNKGATWWYRKWNSGRAECGVDDLAFADQNASHGNVSKPLYCNNQYYFGNYPFPFAAQPSFFVSVNSFTFGKCAYTIAVQSNGTTSKAPGFYINKTTSDKYTGLHCGCYVVGRWK